MRARLMANIERRVRAAIRTFLPDRLQDWPASAIRDTVAEIVDVMKHEHEGLTDNEIRLLVKWRARVLEARTPYLYVQGATP